MRTGIPSAKQSTKELNGKNVKSFTVTTKVSRATGARKPSESRKAKALWAIKQPGTEVKNIMIQLAKKTFWEE